MDEDAPKPRSWAGVVLLVLVIAGIAKIAVWIGLALAVVGLVAVLWRFTSHLDRWLTARDQRRDGRVAAIAAIAARADEQNRLFIAGDPRGTYGYYPPSVPS